MANAVEDSTGYGGGAGGKFRKKPFRRPQTTPYDRPVTARRNTSSSVINNGGSNGWISRIVDPASKLISSSAHKLFSSFFRKRLLPPPTRQPSPDKVESPENHLGGLMNDGCSRIQERDKSEGKRQNNGPVTDGVADLERILNQKTFTRSEIDRLSVLLQSRIVDKSGITGQRRFELTPCEPPVGHSRQEELDGVVCRNKANPSEVLGSELTPAVRSKVNDDDIASPAEIAKAYMGSRSKAVSLSMLGPHVQAVREETHALTRFQSQSPVVRTMQKPLSTPATPQNDFFIPRSRGRSALYSMARTPYSRVLPTETKALVTSNGASIGQPLSTSQKALKRRCSVLENDIGAVGPIRRIRQKSNLFYPKSLGQSSHTPLTHTTSSAVGEASLYSSQEDRGDKDKPVSSMHVSSKSIEMGQRILQQLEKMTPPKEKSSEKKSGISGGISSVDLTSSIEHGQAHKSMEIVDLLKYMHSGQASGKIVDSLGTVLHKVQDSTSEKQDKVHGITGEVVVSFSNKVRRENGDVRITDNDVMGIVKNAAPVVLTSAVDIPKKSQGLQGYLEMNGDACLNGIVSPLMNEDKRSSETSSLKSNGNLRLENPSLPDANKASIPAFPELKPSSNLGLKKNTDMLSTSAEKDIDRSFPTGSIVNKTIESSASPVQPITASISAKADVPASSISFGLLSSDKVSPATMFSSSAAESHSQLPNSTSAFASGASDAGTKSPESTNKTTETAELFRKSDSTAMATSGPDTADKLAVFGKSTSNSLPSTISPPIPSFTNTGFQFGVSTTSSTNNQLQASSHKVSSQPIFGAQALPSKAAFASTTESTPSQPSASAFSVSSSSTNIIGGNLQTTNPPVSGPGFGAPSASTPISASSGFALGTASISTPANGSIAGNAIPVKTSSVSAPSVFGFGAPSSSSASVFSFSSAASASAPASTTSQSPQPSFGNGNSVFAFGSNNGQLKMDDTMVEDSMQQNQAPAFSGANLFQFSSQQNQTAAPSGANPFQFNSQQNQAPIPSGANPFQFSSQQNQAPAPTGANPFQFSSTQQHQAPASPGAVPFQFSSQINQAPAPQNPFQSNDSSGGGSFSLGTGGNDKSNRRIIKVRNRIRKK